MSGVLQWNSRLDIVKTIWNIVITTNGEEIEHTRLVKQLDKTLSLGGLETAEQHIKTALADGLLVEVIRTKQRGKQKSSTAYTIPKYETFSFADDQPDLCCYECHSTGDIIKCDSCMRGFHSNCIKTPDEKQLELEQFVSKQKRITASSFGPRTPDVAGRQSTLSPAVNEDSIVSSVELSSPNNYASDVIPLDDDEVDDDPSDMINISFSHEARTEMDGSLIKLESSFEQMNQNVKMENDVKEGIMTTDEAMFVCLVRPPDRRLEKTLNASRMIKPEESVNDDPTVMARHCYACRLLRDSSKNAQPNITKPELNYLLNFVIEQYKSWLPEDTFSISKLRKGKPVQSLTLERKTIDVCKRMLLRNPKSIADIATAISEERYNTLDEFHVDLEDVAHNVAIIHGVNSLDYSAVMYFLADCVYDLSEIRRCPDCYRHSNEKAEPDWFARPCRTRHELVYAKQKSYQYWPAKVIRVANNKYDVRFFGDKHLRALVDANCVKPIDTELRTLGVNDKHRGFRLAMDEMLKHQALINGYREQFDFRTIDVEMPHILNTVHNHSLPAPLCPEQSVIGERPKGRRGRKRKNANHQSEAVDQTATPDELSLHTSYSEPEPSTSTRGRVSRAKRLASVSQNSIPAKITRSSCQPSVTNSAAAQNSPVHAGKKSTQQNNNTISSNFNSPMPASMLTARLPRTKHNQMLLIPQHNDCFRLKKLFNQVSDPVELKDVALKILKENEERYTRKLELLKETHKRQISDVKKKQWCVVCEMEAVMRCCWNTNYCSQLCQRQHWLQHQTQHQQGMHQESMINF